MVRALWGIPLSGTKTGERSPRKAPHHESGRIRPKPVRHVRKIGHALTEIAGYTFAEILGHASPETLVTPSPKSPVTIGRNTQLGFTCSAWSNTCSGRTDDARPHAQ